MDAGWVDVRVRLARALSRASTPDDVARAVLGHLAQAPDVSRVAIALAGQGGRMLRFCSTDSYEPDAGPTWCEIDALADVPVVHSLLTGRPVWLPHLEALRAAYPHLASRQERLGTRALAAVPLGERVGALLVALSVPDDFSRTGTVLLDVAARAGAALRPQRQGRRGRRNGRSTGAVAVVADSRGRAVLQLPDGTAAPRQARQFLRDRLGDWRVPATTAEDVELCLSEVVTNAVIHAGTDAELAVSVHADRIRVQVSDHGRNGSPGTPAAPHHDAIGGRGLMLIEHLADSWHYERSDDGTTVWFEVRLPNPS